MKQEFEPDQEGEEASEEQETLDFVLERISNLSIQIEQSRKQIMAQQTN